MFLETKLLLLTELFPLQVGKTKVFLRAGQMAELDACRAEVLGLSASVIQRRARTYICRKQYVLLQLSAVELQRVAKGVIYVNPLGIFAVFYYVINERQLSVNCTFLCSEFNAGQLARRRYECMRREAASIKLQKDFRMYVSRKAYTTKYASSICIQTGMRGMAARNDLRFRRRTKAAIIIQVSVFFLPLFSFNHDY